MYYWPQGFYYWPQGFFYWPDAGFYYWSDGIYVPPFVPGPMESGSLAVWVAGSPVLSISVSGVGMRVVVG